MFYNRNTIIDPSMVNKEFRVDTGNSFKVIKISFRKSMLKAFIGERFKRILAIEFSIVRFKYFIQFISVIIFYFASKPKSNLN